MFRNWLAVTLRRVGRHKGYAFVNVLGLAVGMACAILIFLYVRYELSFDGFHEKADRIYRVTVNNDARSPRSLGPALKETYPEIRQYVRMLPTFGTWIMKHEDRIYYEKRVYWADHTFFDVFSFPLVRGDPGRALEAPYTVVISEDTARKYFGDADPLGKTIDADNGYLLLTVTGVMKNIPENAHFHTDFVISLATGFEKFGWIRNSQIWLVSTFYTYVLLEEGHPPARTEARFPVFVETHIDDEYRGRGGRFDMKLQPIGDIHLHSRLENEAGDNSDIAYVYILSAVGLFILVIASVNYVNLSTALFADRTREVGLRKVLGASRILLMRQHLGESICMAVFALAVALLAVRLASPHFDALLGMPVTGSFAFHPAWWSVLAVIAVLIGVLSGGYPALVFSTLGTVPGLKEGRTGAPGGALPRKILVVFQFAIASALIICTGVFFGQMRYIQDKQLGFDKDLVIVIPTVEAVAVNYQAWKDVMLRHTGVAGVSIGSSVPGLVGSVGRFSTGRIRRVDDAADVWHDVRGLQTAADYVETLGMEILAGRSHRGPLRDNPDHEHVVVNDAVRRALGWNTPEEAVGRLVRFAFGEPRTVIGVVRDFHYRTLHEPILPIVFFHGVGQHLVIRVEQGDVGKTLSYIEEEWSRFFPGFPFAYSFLDEEIDRLYRSEARIGYFFGVFALIAVFLTGLGLFALVSFSVGRRTREIGIRKALGASVRRMLAALSAEFVLLALIANILAWPAAWLIMSRWLENFAYRIEIGWEIFLVSAGAALIIAIVTIGFHVIRAALANPAEVLRGE